MESEEIRFLLSNENKHRASYGYMSNQKEFTPRMRRMVINWLMDVHSGFKFKKHSLYLTVNIIDRYLSKKQIQKGLLQLLATSAFTIAAKYEGETISIGDLAGVHSKTDIRSMELKILDTINYSLTHVVTIANFSDILLTGFDDKTKSNVDFLCNTALLDYELLRFAPSVVAGACLVISTNSLDFNFYDLNIDHVIEVKRILSKQLPELKMKKRKYVTLCIFKNSKKWRYEA
jgi:cyclin B